MIPLHYTIRRNLHLIVATLVFFVLLNYLFIISNSKKKHEDVTMEEEEEETIDVPDHDESIMPEDELDMLDEQQNEIPNDQVAIPLRDTFIVITTLFNPAGYASRYNNYHTFSTYMKDSGIRLITVEAIFPSLNQTEFQVTSPHNPDHIQIRSRSVFWMKENLINVAVSRVSSKDPSVKYLAWLDADIKFEEENWVELIIQALEKYAVVQVFKFAIRLGSVGGVERVDYSFGFRAATGDKYKPKMWRRGMNLQFAQPGFGWAMTLDACQTMGGLPSCNLVGSGDQHFAGALLNTLDLPQSLPPEMFVYYKTEASNIYTNLKEWMTSQPQFPHLEGIIGYADTTVTHTWHGSRTDRNYKGRWDILINHGVRCDKDMKVNDDGVLEFVEGREELEKEIIQYFRGRREDGERGITSTGDKPSLMMTMGIKIKR